MTTNSNPFTDYYLVREVLERLGKLGYRNDIKVSSPEVLKTIKERLITGPVEITLNQKNRFKAVLPARDYHEALCKRHYYGVRRVHRLCKSADRLASVKWATAWTLTTCYYGAYFAALELMELTGKHIIYLSPEEADQVDQFAKTSGYHVGAGPYLGIAQLDASNDEVEISFGPSAKKPHEFAWEKLDELVRTVVAERADAIRHQGSLIRFLGRDASAPWSRPNEVRNLWNYTDASLFSERGDRAGKKMVEYVLAQSEAIKWGVGKHLHQCEEDHASSISYIRASLFNAVSQVADRVLPENLVSSKAA